MAERDPRQSECTICEAGVLQCAHFGDLTLWLTDNSDDACPPIPGHYSSEELKVLGPARPVICTKRACPDHLVMWANESNAATFPTLAEAHAQFDRRAELLRLGAVDVA